MSFRRRRRTIRRRIGVSEGDGARPAKPFGRARPADAVGQGGILWSSNGKDFSLRCRPPERNGQATFEMTLMVEAREQYVQRPVPKAV
jgi:hypothetical protein